MKIQRLKQLLLTGLLVLPSVLWADTNMWLTFHMSDNTELSVPAGNLKMDYSEGVIRISADSVNNTIEVNTIKSMKFTSSPAGIDDIIDNSQGQDKELFDLSGVRIGTFGSLDDARTMLPSGIYVVKNGNRSLKVIF